MPEDERSELFPKSANDILKQVAARKATTKKKEDVFLLCRLFVRYWCHVVADALGIIWMFPIF